MKLLSYLIVFSLLFINSVKCEVSIEEQLEVRGDDSCPCLEAMELPPIDDESSSLPENMDTAIDFATYGIGCALHDVNITLCQSSGGGGADDDMGPQECDMTGFYGGIPVPADCSRNWCWRKWCYVDANHCHLLHKHSTLLHNRTRFYSYATCGYADSFTDDALLAQLRGKVLRVGYNRNSGGWTGSYHPETHFATTPGWRGPTVGFVTQAALRGGFTINITRPPDWLIPFSQEYFTSASKFDLCVYATSLGYLDLCVADYAITDKRAAMSKFFQLQNKPIYMITIQGGQEQQRTTAATFSDNFVSIFQPFTLGAWCMILFVMLPLMGVLFIYHEYGEEDGAFPRESTVAITDREGNKEIQSQKIPWYRHVVRALYMGTLGFFQQSYGQRIVSIGGKFNLLGISFFILIIITIYTSNLAAILTQEARITGVESLEEAKQAGYRFCTTRTGADFVMNLDPTLRDSIVVDPPELGGDGLPGFACANCSARTRIFEYMAQRPHPNHHLYCDAAVTIPENLEEFQNQGLHCDKTIVGQPVGYAMSGLPIASHYAEPLTALFLMLRNEGVMIKEMNQVRPSNSCAELGQDGESLSIEELTAVWVITSAFAVLGVAAKLARLLWKKRKRRLNAREGSLQSVQSVSRFDQWGGVSERGVLISQQRLESSSSSRQPEYSASQRAVSFASDHTGSSEKRHQH